MNSQRLLILDDDPLSGQTIGNVAELAGYDVQITSNHLDFFRVLKDWEPGIIALDLVMPDMDGVEVIAELGRRQCRAQIIITSGIGGRVLDAASRTAAERGLHIAGVLPKPFAPATLRELLTKSVAGAMDEHRAAQARREPDTERRKVTPRDLELAIANHELCVSYQPKVSCKTAVLSGFEALARWSHPSLGIIPPDEFIPMAEANDLIDSLTIEVMTQAMQWYSSFRAQLAQQVKERPNLPDPDKLSLSINISARSLSNTQIFDRLTVMCSEYGIHPDSVIFELTETSAMEDPVSSLELLTRLRLRGFRLSIDDFGTGYSSMVQLVKLPFSELKVDKSFVITARESEESRAVIKSVVSLGTSLGLIVTAEGIEDEDTEVFLRNIGCTLAQGYLFARPLSGDHVMAWLAARDTDSEQRRLQTLTTLRLLDTPAEERFDTLTRLCRGLFKVPMAVFSLIDSERLWFKSRYGVNVPGVMRTSSFCNQTIEFNRIFAIQDTRQHEEFSKLGLVTNPPYIRFYAGCPVHAADGATVGTLTLLDTSPRLFTDLDGRALQKLAHLVEEELYGSSEDSQDALTRVFNQQTTERRIPQILDLCLGAMVPCVLHVFEVLNLAPGAANDNNLKNQHLLTPFGRFLLDCYGEADFVGRFDRNKFVVLLISPDEKEDKMTRWKLESAIRSHNQGSLPDFEVQYRLGSAHTQVDGYGFQSLLDKADQAMSPF